MALNFVFILSVFNILIFTSSKSSKSTQDIKNNKIDEISSIYSWAKKNKIYIHENLSLKKNEINDINHNFYYFKSNAKIPNNTLMLKIPSNIMISQNALENILKKSKNQKLSNLWEKILSINQYINYSSAKQLFYISVALSDATFRQKGKFYKKYKEYLEMYNYINYDHFPLLYTAKEIIYLNNSHFGKEIKNNIKSINNEYYLIKNVLNLDNSVQVEDFIKYRLLSLSNSFYFKNKTYIIPFIDCFQKKVNKTNGKYNAYIKITLNSPNTTGFNLEIYSNKTIKKNEEIKLLWKQISNVECLLYYGFIDEDNLITSEYLVELVNKNFMHDLKIEEINTKYGIDFDKLVEPKFYDLNNDFFDEYFYYVYRNLSDYIDKYYHNNEGPYQMMKDNLEYYLQLYEEMYNNDIITMNIEGINKKRYVKNILGIEQKLIQNRIKILNNKINSIRNEKEEKDIYDLLRRNAKIRNKNLEFRNNNF